LNWRWRFAFTGARRNVNGGDDSKYDNEKFLHETSGVDGMPIKGDSG
jgi:hypothetical protein